MSKRFRLQLFEIEFLPEALEYLNEIPIKAKDNILFNMAMAKSKKDPKLLKPLQDGIWYFRAQQFGIAVIRAKFYPAWTGVIIILGILIFVVAMTSGFQIIANINNIILSITIIYMCILGYRQLRNQDAMTVQHS